MEIIQQTKAKMLACIEHLKTELKAIRTGRANPAMVDGVLVDVYGSNMRIKELASVNSPEPKMLVIVPFDPKNVGLVSKAIEKANIGIMPVIDGHTIRLKIPVMDENMRREMVKIIHKKLEEAKISIRNVRRDSNEVLKKQKPSEDEVKKIEKEIQTLTDNFCKDAESLAKQKETEVIHV